jgi:hypothetical protein
VRDYVRINQAAVRGMHRQVGDLAINAEGVHLPQPNGAIPSVLPGQRVLQARSPDHPSRVR